MFIIVMNKDSKAAVECVEELTSQPVGPGAIISLSEEAMRTWNNPDLVQLVDLGDPVAMPASASNRIMVPKPIIQ